MGESTRPAPQNILVQPEDSDEDFSGMPALEDKEQNQALKEKNIEEKEDVIKVEDTPVILDDDGWEDVLGSGRLKKKIVKEGEEGCKPGKGARVKVKVEERVD